MRSPGRRAGGLRAGGWRTRALLSLRGGRKGSEWPAKCEYISWTVPDSPDIRSRPAASCLFSLGTHTSANWRRPGATRARAESGILLTQYVTCGACLEGRRGSHAGTTGSTGHGARVPARKGVGRETMYTARASPLQYTRRDARSVPVAIARVNSAGSRGSGPGNTWIVSRALEL